VPPSTTQRQKTKEKDAQNDDAGIGCAVRERKSLHRQPIAGTCVEELAGLVALSATRVGAKARAVGELRMGEDAEVGRHVESRDKKYQRKRCEERWGRGG
jgi:hypothetical protein